MEIHKDHENLLHQIESSPYRPSDLERADLCDQLKIYEEELYKLEMDIAIRLAHRSRIDKHINRCRGALAPYSKLPVELIEEIIEHSSTIQESTPLSKGEIGMRLQVTQICRSWRLVAFDAPTLWNACFEELPTRGIVNLVAAWFRQCSSTEIWLGCSKWLDWMNYPDRDYFLKGLLVPYSHRFTALSMFPHDISYPASLRLDRLTTLEYSRIAPWTMPTEPIFVPSLRSFSVSCIGTENYCRLLQDLSPLPWGQLTDITLKGNLEFSDVYDILGQCASLESCHLETIDRDSLNIHQDTLLDLPHLKILRIKFSILYTLQRLFMFNAPNLTLLAINNLTKTPELFNKFTIYVTRLQKTLRTFKSSSGRYDYMISIDDIMQALPFIKHFDAKGRHVSPSALTKIGRGELLPNVEVLHLEEEAEYPWKMMVDRLVPDEQPRRSRLRDIHIRTIEDERPSHRREELGALGINIHLIKLHIRSAWPLN